jgi:hypothetical protein
MSTLDELKKGWQTNPPTPLGTPHYDQAALLAITQARSARQVNRAIQYFWASFTLQLIVYGLLSHVLVRFRGTTDVQWLCFLGVLLYLPFTVVLMRQFKRIARANPDQRDDILSIQARIQQQYNNLKGFYRFKRNYEYCLIPLITALGVYLIFRLYVPGGVSQHLTGATTTYLLSLLACGWAIRRENNNHFKQPLGELEQVLDKFKNG